MCYVELRTFSRISNSLQCALKSHLCSFKRLKIRPGAPSSELSSKIQAIFLMLEKKTQRHQKADTHFASGFHGSFTRIPEVPVSAVQILRDRRRTNLSWPLKELRVAVKQYLKQEAGLVVGPSKQKGKNQGEKRR